MKKLFALLAVALTGFGVVAAELSPETLGMETAHALSSVTTESAREQVNALKAQITQGTELQKLNWAFVDACVYARETPKATYAQIKKRFESSCKELGVESNFTEARIRLLMTTHSWSTGSLNPERQKAALAEYEEGGSPKIFLGYIQILKSVKGLEAALTPEFLAVPKWLGEAVTRLILAQNLAKADEIFFEYLPKGAFPCKVGEQVFPTLLAYELEKEGFDAAALKAKLNKAILLYKAKARQWKPTKEGKANPYIEFVGMLQDTAKDL